MGLGTLAAAALGPQVLGSVLGSKSQAKAADKAADAAVQVAQENNALARDIYGQNKATISPFVDRGNTAGNYINAFLGLDSGTGTTGTGGTAADWGAYLHNNPDVLQGYYTTADQSQFSTPESYAQWHYKTYGQNEGRTMPTTGGTGAAPAVTQDDAKNAFADYLGNSDYAYQSALGGEQVSGNYSGLGALQSGAAMKALQDRQNNINQGYQTNWLGQLGSQQNAGLSGASALAGVGQNLVSNVSANNNNAGNATANAALIKGNNNPFANALGTFSGTILGAM